MTPTSPPPGIAAAVVALRRPWLVSLLLAVLVAGAIAGPANAATDVPSDIAVPAGNKLFLSAHAVGVQIYTCNTTPTGYSWSSAKPRADLFDNTGKLVMTHFQGPTWQAKDGSTVVGQREAGVTVDPTAIQWLRLAAASTARGADGARLLATSYIQRINTADGLVPPAPECNALTVGIAVEVPYTADYLFWKAQGN